MKNVIACLALVALVLPTLLVPSTGRAAMTDWTEVQGGAVRLIAAGPLEDGHYLAGLEFLLEPGWHTYWRYPGEAGIPPQISLGGSSNLKSLEVLYPAPERYSDGFSESIVYHDGIVLPLLVTPDDPQSSVALSVDLFFGICKEICVPGDAALRLDLAPGMADNALAERLIRRDLARVPAAGPAGDLGITSVALAESGETLSIEASIGTAGAADLFAAAPEGSYIALPKPAGTDNGKAVWSLSTKGLKTTGTDNILRLVLVAGDTAIEHLEPIPSGWTR